MLALFRGNGRNLVHAELFGQAQSRSKEPIIQALPPLFWRDPGTFELRGQAFRFVLQATAGDRLTTRIQAQKPDTVLIIVERHTEFSGDCSAAKKAAHQAIKVGILSSSPDYLEPFPIDPFFF